MLLLIRNKSVCLCVIVHPMLMTTSFIITMCRLKVVDDRLVRMKNIQKQPSSVLIGLTANLHHPFRSYVPRFYAVPLIFVVSLYLAHRNRLLYYPYQSKGCDFLPNCSIAYLESPRPFPIRSQVSSYIECFHEKPTQSAACRKGGIRSKN